MMENIGDLIKTLLPGLGGLVGGVIGENEELRKTISEMIGLLPVLKEMPNIISVPGTIEYLSSREALMKETVGLVGSLPPLLGRFAPLLPEMMPLLTEVSKLTPEMTASLIKGGLPILNEVLSLTKDLTKGLIE